jgi:peptidoglycan-N-acetylglucosamine deacetylase
MAVTVTFDLEDNRVSPTQEVRFVRMTERFAEFMDEVGARGTFFVVGELAHSNPSLIRDLAGAGHEIALHGLRHVTLGDTGPAKLRDELVRGRALLEDLTGRAVTGFRAPIFSLTPATSWATEDIQAAGFAYSSSVLPAGNPLHGWPSAPRHPFRWPGGLLELPCPLLGRGRHAVPFLGGVYLRYLPRRLVVAGLKRLDEQACAWSYLHPYDLDADERFFVLPHAGWLTSRIVHARRRGTLERLRAVLDAAGEIGPPLGEIAMAQLGVPSYSR